MDKNIDSKTLAIEIAKILDKKKAQDVRVLKVDSLTVLTDYFVIASGTSTTQVGSLADEVEYELSQSGIEPHTTEGFDSKNWVLLDYSSVIVHVFVPNTRTYYDLEHLWADGEPIDISEFLSFCMGIDRGILRCGVLSFNRFIMFGNFVLQFLRQFFDGGKVEVNLFFADT